MQQIYERVTSYKFSDNQVLERQGTPTEGRVQAVQPLVILA